MFSYLIILFFTIMFSVNNRGQFEHIFNFYYYVE